MPRTKKDKILQAKRASSASAFALDALSVRPGVRGTARVRRTGFDRGIGMAHPSPCGAVGGCGAVGLARSDARARRPRRFPSVITDSGGNRASNNDEGWRGRGVRGRERDARGWGPPGEASRVARRAGRRARTPDGWSPLGLLCKRQSPPSGPPRENRSRRCGYRPTRA